MDQDKENLLSGEVPETTDVPPPFPEQGDKPSEEHSHTPPPSFPEQPPPYVDLPPSSQPVLQPPPPGYGPVMMQQFPPSPSSQPVLRPPPPGYGPVMMQQFPPPPSSQPVYPGAPPPPQVQPGYLMQQSNVAVVTSQPVLTPAHYVQVKPANHIILSVITMIFFCWVFGLIALLFAIQVDSAWDSGDRQRAQQRSSAARSWSMAGIVFGVVAYIVVVVSTVVRVIVLT